MGQMLAVLVGLLLFGVFYNAFVEYLERSGRDRGYTAFLVVGGTLVTVAGSAVVIGVTAAGFVLLCFAASGLPMVIGSGWRHVQARAAEEDELRRAARELLNGNKA